MFESALIEEAGRRLADAAPGARVLLFGSHARGEAGPRSDLDFMVIEPRVENRAVESVRLRRALRGLGLFADIVVISEDDARSWGDVRGSLIHAALSEGRTIAA